MGKISHSLAIAVAILCISASPPLPTSIGPAYGAPASQALLFASQAIGSHEDIFQHWRNEISHEIDESEFVAAGNEIAFSKLMKRKAPLEPACEPEPILIVCEQAIKRLSLWSAPFYANAFQKKDESILPSRNQILGTVVGIDYWPTKKIVLGGGAGYAFDYAGAFAQGHAKIDEGFGFFYTSYRGRSFFVNFSASGGYYRLKSNRHTPGFATSKGKTHGWLASPHIEFCYADYMKSSWFATEPYLLADWASNWQHSYSEIGLGALNMAIPSLRNSLFRGEAGLGFYQTMHFSWGRFMLRERFCYINKTPFDFRSITAALVGSPSTFSILTGTNETLNLGGARINLAFFSNNGAYGQLSFLTEYCPSYISYFGGAEIGRNF